jgi:hypothetical protein
VLRTVAALMLIVAPGASADFRTQPTDRALFCAHMHLRGDGRMLQVDPGARIDTNEFSGMFGPGAIMYRGTDVFTWIVDHCRDLLHETPPPVPGQQI